MCGAELGKTTVVTNILNYITKTFIFTQTISPIASTKSTKTSALGQVFFWKKPKNNAFCSSRVLPSLTAFLICCLCLQSSIRTSALRHKKGSGPKPQS